jgi:hypothetical protein
MMENLNMKKKNSNYFKSLLTLSFITLTLVSCQSGSQVCTVEDIYRDANRGGRCFSEVGAQVAIGDVFRLQQDHFSESGAFYSTLDELKEDLDRRDKRLHDGLVASLSLHPYEFDMEVIQNGELIPNQVVMWAVPTEENLRAHVGILAIDQNRVFAYCSSDEPSQQRLGKPNLVENPSTGNIEVACPEGSSIFYSQGI